MHMGEKEREAEEEKGCTHAVWRVVGERKSLRTREREGEGEKECTHVVQRVVGKRKSLRTWEREGEGEKEKERTHAVGRGKECVHTGEREQESTWFLLLHVFFPLGLLYANWAQPGVLFYLKSSLWSSDISLTFLCSIFVDFSLPFLLATSILDSFSLF